MGLFDSGLGNRNGLSPAAIALLGVLAVKGYQNRDKIAQTLQGVLGGNAGGTTAPGDASSPATATDSEGGLGGLLGGLGKMLGGNASTGSVVSGGLGDLLNGFQQAGHGDLAASWVKDGPDQQPAPHQVEQAVGPDLVDQLAKETGLSRDELLKRLTTELPKAIDGLTPEGRIPTPQEAEPAAGSGLQA